MVPIGSYRTEYHGKSSFYNDLNFDKEIDQYFLDGMKS